MYDFASYLKLLDNPHYLVLGVTRGEAMAGLSPYAKSAGTEDRLLDDTGGQL